MTGTRIFTLGTLILLLLCGPLPAQKRGYHCKKTEQVLNFIGANHYSPVPVNEEFNTLVSKTFINSLDPLGLFFTRGDAEGLMTVCPDLSALDCAKSKNFMDQIVSHYNFCLLYSETMMDAVFSDPVDFHKDDTLVIPEPLKTVYPAGMSGLQENWVKYLKFQMLRYFFTTYRSTDTSFVRDESNFMLNQDSLKAGVLQREYCKINHLLEYPGGFSEYIFGLYLNTLTGSFDPHTNYFSSSDKDLFVSSISRNKRSFGADLDQNDDGEIVIARLIPGGPAWRSGEVSAGDILLRIRFPKRDPIDLICSNLEEIRDMIYNAGSDRIEVTLRSGLGQVKVVELRMEELSASENAVYSFMLKGDLRIGYISLPGFYTEPDNHDPMGCASDLVKEIIRLEADGMEGLILDVRNNGGGSISEAVDLAGIFIDSGPLCTYRRNGEKPALIKDLKPGIVYDGPLVLMINGYSASAAEILAGILQDYNRALIVGTPSFGKASGQIIVPLSDPGRKNSGYYYYDEEPSDFIKITTTRYYRLNGTSHQGSGIVPDIGLPSHAGYSRIKESAYPSALRNDTAGLQVTFEPFPPLPADKLRHDSETRIHENPNFLAFNALNDSIRPLYTGTIKIPLEFHAFDKEYHKNKSVFNRIDSLSAVPGLHYSITSNSHDSTLLLSDAYTSEIHAEIIANLTRDFYLEEAYLVMGDLIKSLGSQNKEME